MEGLLIDNGSKVIVELLVLFKAVGANMMVMPVSKFSSTTDYNFVVMSGSSQNSVQHHSQTVYAQELEFLKTTKLPVLGVCLGLELVAEAFGGQVRKQPRKVEGMFTLQVTDKDGLFDADGEIVVFESHRWAVSDPGPQLTTLAVSEHGVEAVKHVSKPIYGVQFHPELSGEIGAAVVRNFLNSATA